jgi:hypothetical protein
MSPSIKESTNPDLSGYSPVVPTTPAPASAPTTDTQPSKNVFLRCALPTLWKSDPDALRQFPNPTVPQQRIFTPITPTVSGNVSETSYISGGVGGSGGGGSPTIQAAGGTTNFRTQGQLQQISA